MSVEYLLQRSARVYAAQTTLTTTAQPLGSSNEDLTELVIQADPDNIVDILIGSSAVQCWKMSNGTEFNCPIRNPALLYGRTASGTAVCNLIGRMGV